MRKKLLSVLGECGKVSSLIDNISVVKRYASESSHAIPVSSDDQALLKARKEVRVHIRNFLLKKLEKGSGGPGVYGQSISHTTILTKISIN